MYYFIEQNNHPTHYLDEILLFDGTNSGLHQTFEYVNQLNEPDVEVYAWITDHDGSNGVAALGGACNWPRSSLTRGPSRSNSVVETAEVN